jgi:CheY-like chemotaxis protein
VRTGKLEEEQMNRAVETIERNARSQSQLIDDLLDVSRIITGKLKIEARSVDLGAVLEAAIEAVRPSFEAKSIRFENMMDSQALLIPGDANRLQQIFWNLFNNAVKFTPEGGEVRVEVECDVSRARISVTDSGIGMSPEFLPYIFDRFRQADGSTTRVHGGLGLGLSIVKHLVQLHQGTIEVESKGKDQGSRFTVSLPLTLAGSPDLVQNAVTEVESTELPSGFSRVLDGLRIMIVDDEADARELVRAILSECGSDVNCCESAAEALVCFREWKPDLLVSDIGMPGEDGYDLIRKLRKMRSKRAKQMPAVALTAYATKEDKARALAAGFQMHVSKPIEPEVLIMSIAAALGRKI